MIIYASTVIMTMIDYKTEYCIAGNWLTAVILVITVEIKILRIQTIGDFSKSLLTSYISLNNYFKIDLYFIWVTYWFHIFPKIMGEKWSIMN